ncbi:MAG: metal ABC transporter permease, partial [Cyanobacteria bacterium J06632_22]
MDLWQILIDPLQYGFMQRSLIVAVLVGIICSVVGSYLMVQRLALLGDAISHSVLPG